jgi:hypothetical protein
MRKIVFIFFAFLIAPHSFAQTSVKDLKEEHKERTNALQKEDEEGVIDYKTHFAFGAKLISDGYGFFFELGKEQSVKKSLLFQFEFAERKSAKEVKQQNPNTPAPSLIYGKENFFYPLKLGVQQQVLLGNKSNKNGICITANYGGGFCIGLLRPYYVEIDTNSVVGNIKYNSPDSIYFLNKYDLVGGPTFGQGWSDLSVIPGLYTKGAIRFDYGHDNKVLSAIEIGISAEYYTQKVPIMVYSTPKQFFVTAYAAIMFGGRQ